MMKIIDNVHNIVRFGLCSYHLTHVERFLPLAAASEEERFVSVVWLLSLWVESVDVSTKARYLCWLLSSFINR